MSSRLATILSGVAVAVLVAGTLGGSAQGAPQSFRGTATKAVDGDTVKVEIPGVGLVSVRNAGIQAMEIGECHAAAATNWMQALTGGKNVKLSSTVDTKNDGRPVLFMDVVASTGSTDPQRTLLDKGLVLGLNLSEDRTRGHEYQLAMERAAARGLNLWDTDDCKPGPQQSISKPDMWATWDLDMSDSDKNGTASENVKIRNTSTTQTLDLSGWYIRDASHYRPYVFPSGTKVAPRGVVTLFVGAGTRTKTSFFWNRNLGAFANPTSLTSNSYGGLYLMDRDHDIRSHVTWPCVLNCGAVPALKISHVEDNPPGSDYDNLHGEYVSIIATGSKTVDLSKVSLVLGGHVFNFAASQTLKPGQVLRVRGGKGTNTFLTKYWQYTHPVLANSGTIRLRTAGAVPISCAAWGGDHC